MVRTKQLTYILFLCGALSLTGCSFSLDWLRYFRARRAASQHDYRTSLKFFQEITRAHPDSARALYSARLGARVAHLEAGNYPLAIEFYRLIILRSENPDERRAAQRNIAQIYFENLLDYAQSVTEYERLLHLENPPEEAFKYRLNLAKAQFQLNNLEQATDELDVLLSQKRTDEEAFDAKSLKANILVAGHHLSDAASAWEQILKEFPERSKKENVAMNLVVCYEELKDFGSAIDVLERMKADYPNPDFLNIRIERLKERKSNQPGAQGLKR
jgi:tetratricopeptide (TPR) repeat protein